MRESFSALPEASDEFTPAQERVINDFENYKQGIQIEHELRVSEAKDLRFLQRLTSFNLPVELAIVEHINGLARVSLGADDAQGVASITDTKKVERMISGKFSIHSHPNNDRLGLIPSSGDMNVNRERSLRQSTPAVIIDGWGFAIVGVNPYSQMLDDKLKSAHKFGVDESMDSIIERGGVLKNLPALYESLFNSISRVHCSEDLKEQALAEFAEETGLILKMVSWEDANDEDLDVGFNQRAAGLMWLARVETITEALDSGEKSVEDIARHAWNIKDAVLKRFHDRARAAAAG